MDGARWLHCPPQRGTNLHRQQASVLIAMLDGFGQHDRLWHHPRGPSRFAGGCQLAIGPHQDILVAVPAITEPAEGALAGSLHGGRHCLLDQILVQRAGGAGDHEATVAVLDEAAPAFSIVRLLRCSLFFCTNDQNSSISTWLRCRSLASTSVMADAWLATRLSHTLIVSYLCPVISSAARKLPRRITINSAWATSAAGVFNPYIGV